MENNNQTDNTAVSGCSGNRSLSLKQLGGVWLGKALMGATRITGRGGTTLPGRAALKLAPDVLPYLGRQLPQGSVLVTGTNGKTTTSYLLTAILRQAGYRCVHNQSGSNLSWGVASSLIGATTWSGKLPGDFGVLEVDEGAFPAVVKNLQPRGAVVTNIYRDQLDRYGEVDHIQRVIRDGLEALPEGAFQVINADDPSLADLHSQAGRQVKKWFYGLELELAPDHFENTARDIKSCPRCHRKLHYDRVYFAHLGHYHCPSCDFARPEPDVKLVGRTNTAGGGVLLDLSLQGEPLQAAYPLMGSYNMYNVLAAATCSLALGVPAPLIKSAIEAATPSFGRMERFNIDDRNLLIALIKNPVGANEVLRTVIEQAGKIHLFIAINDKIADGTDVSWLWDVDFEQLAHNRERLASVVVSGIRAWDMAVRLKYAGLDPAVIRVEENMNAAVSRALELTPAGETLFALPTYTAMFEMRRALNSLSAVKPYWEGS